MAALRHLPDAHRRWLLLIAVVALIARALVPAGWMPVAGAQGVTLALCDGGQPSGGAMAHPMTMTHGGAPMEHHHGAPDHPCAFAAATAAFTTPDLVAPPPPVAPRHRPPPARAAAAIGHGLAAPPPPPTGPPALA